MTREEFLEWARQEVVAPRTIGEHEPFGQGYYWAGLVSRGTYLAVDALANGKLRVHLYTSDDEIKQQWSARRPTVPPIPVAHAWTWSGLRNNGSGKRAYLGCEWMVSSSDYSRERELVRQVASWLEHFYRAE